MNSDSDDRSGWSCRSDWNRDGATPTPSVMARNYPQDQDNWKGSGNYNNGNNQIVPQATPVANNKDEAHDDDPDNHNHDDKGIKAISEKLE
ncbi:uncharacterized protein N7496_006443 [Penicillium cataractarum]|uniref:Uncharacterized protein n=1 Tax=Penicillium cataractarum TaxID=2100454 RepID=A0A9W9S1J2_9EURO|nr:uncharacterized protein N7496_006443 [Penicillium cataractarum]KAJ5370351.1 hypothetical protein N7496_006443 [Penicillium cataractarum]